MKALIEVDPNRLVGVLNLAAMALADPQNKDAFLDDFDAVVTARNEAKRWHKYPDEMPEDAQKVLIFTSDGFIETASFYADYVWPKNPAFVTQDDLENYSPLYWMELPSPPEEQE